MDKNEPTLVPQWYRAGRISSSNGNSNHRCSSSTNTDNQGIRLYSRNRLTSSTSSCDSFQYPVSTDANSNTSYHRSRSFSGPMGYGRSTPTARSRPYNNFGRGYCDKGRERIIGSHEKSSDAPDNGYSDYTDIFSVGRNEKDPFLRTQLNVAGRCLESQPKRVGNDLHNGIVSPKRSTGGINESLFERDFPSLSAEEKLSQSEISRVSATALGTVSQSHPLGSSAPVCGKGWTSALAEVPCVVGGNRSTVSSAQQCIPSSSVPVAPSPNTGLNMAETVAKALSSTRLAPQLSDDNEKREELAKKQFKHLIPVTPATPKSSAFNSSERSKTKGTKTGSTSTPTKFISHTSQHANYPNRGTARSDGLKTHQAGNFLVLNRERSSSTSTTNKVLGPMVANKDANSVNFVPNHATSCNPKHKPGGMQGCTTEKRLYAQDRISFFNTIRNGSSANNSQQQSANPHTTEEAGEQALLRPNLDCRSLSPTLNGNGFKANHDDLVETERLSVIDEVESSTASITYSDIPDEEEIKFLRSLGWKEGSGEEALTPEEIDAFVRESGHLLNSVKVSCCHQNQ